MGGSDTINAMVLGAAGYGGGELLRLLHGHPSVAETRAVSRSHAGQPWHAAHPRLRGFVDGVFLSQAEWTVSGPADRLVLFSAQPNGALAAQWADLMQEAEAAGVIDRLTVIDLSGDFRLADPALYQSAYGQPHPAPGALRQWVYGLPEHHEADIRQADYIANPGCFATAVQLALKPLLDVAAPDWVAVTGVTGSSGSGVHPSATTHHPERANDFRAYRMLAHQHEAEIIAGLGRAGSHGTALSFVPHSAPMVRGIFVTVQARIDDDLARDLPEAYAEAYADQPFVRRVDGSPRIHHVIGSNACDIGVTVRDGQVVVMAALDNLIKGMAGQAVQNMNLALGRDVRSGLLTL
jgi:LysW-gamma-L-alpha-aminoadipyl-6-phosphate/LysW-L-glutamyl-5-phosphate reductase